MHRKYEDFLELFQIGIEKNEVFQSGLEKKMP